MVSGNGDADADGRSYLKVERLACGIGMVVRAVGEIDVVTISSLHEELTSAQAAVTAPDAIVVDLTDVHFIGAVGLHELMAQHVRAEAKGTPLGVVARDNAVLRLFEIVSTDPTIDVFPDVDTALRCLRHRAAE